VGRESGISEDQLIGITNHRASDAFSDFEKDVLDYAVALTNTPATATDEQVTGLRKNLSDEQLVELTTAIAWENFRARFNRGFDVQDQGFSAGAVCAIPDRPGSA
jgi:4-carboxymuconolactone decarboxylase